MARLPFNPDRMSAKATSARAGGPPSGSAGGGSGGTVGGGDESRAGISVSQLAVLVDQALRDAMPSAIRVLGELGQFRARTHWYFDLKDAGAVVSCVMWQSAARKAGFEPETGQQVLVTGRVEFYAPQGRTQFVVDKIEPVGVGALDLAFRKLVVELRELGWFEESRKRPLPILPRKLAIVTSAGGAALQDVLDTIRRRCPGLPLAMVDVRVQGDGAAEQVAKAVTQLGLRHAQLGVDVILVTRGGGSREDLAAFNQRSVAAAIVACPIPVVAAIGHETDTSIAELVADVRAATPTQAAMRIAPDAGDLERQLDSFHHRLANLLDQGIEERADHLNALARHLRTEVREHVSLSLRRTDQLAFRLERRRPAAVYAQRLAQLSMAQSRLKDAMRRRLQRSQLEPLADRLQASASAMIERRLMLMHSAARGLDLVGPHSVLRRGYSVTLASDGRVIRSAGDVKPGDRVLSRLADGAFASQVMPDGGDSNFIAPISPARNEHHRAAPPIPRSAKPRRRLQLPKPEGPSLFG